MSERMAAQRNKDAAPVVTAPSSFLAPGSAAVPLGPAVAPAPQMTETAASLSREGSGPEQTSSQEGETESGQERAGAIGHHFRRLSVLRPQAKMTVSQPTDPAEEEADEVADQVMRAEAPLSVPGVSGASVHPSRVARQ